MRILITAGSTHVPIDAVRTISNVFGGKTGELLAQEALRQGHHVTLLTSKKDPFSDPHLLRCLYTTYDELAQLLEQAVRSGAYDALIHSAAVSDYRVVAVHTPENLYRTLLEGASPTEPSRKMGKISSSHERLFLELAPTIKLIDQVRSPWNFSGQLVKFKLQVGLSDEALIQIATRSLEASRADWIVANCREWARERAYLIGSDGTCKHVSRNALPAELLQRITS